jgi:hypothetical protein
VTDLWECIKKVVETETIKVYFPPYDLLDLDRILQVSQDDYNAKVAADDRGKPLLTHVV